MKLTGIALALLFGVGQPFQAPQRTLRRGARSTMRMALYDGKYKDELRETAAAMTALGKGLLACDESTGTVGSRLESIGLENNEVGRQSPELSSLPRRRATGRSDLRVMCALVVFCVRGGRTSSVSRRRKPDLSTPA